MADRYGQQSARNRASRDVKNAVVTDWLTRPEGLATRLRAARTTAALTTSALGEQAGWSHAKVSRIENGRTLPSVDDIQTWAQICGLKNSATKQLITELKATRSLHLQMRSSAGVDQAEHQQTYSEILAAATSIGMFETYAVPGLLQIADYAQAVLEVWGRFLNFDDTTLEAAALKRAARSQHLYDSDKSFHFVLSQTALQWRPCEPQIMRAQLDRLLMAADLPNVTLGIIPLSPTATVPPLHSFSIYDETVFIETWTGELIHTEPAIVDQYRATLDLLTEAAVSGQEAADLITTAIGATN